jgi:hypothetical protein
VKEESAPTSSAEKKSLKKACSDIAKGWDKGGIYPGEQVDANHERG